MSSATPADVARRSGSRWSIYRTTLVCRWAGEPNEGCVQAGSASSPRQAKGWRERRGRRSEQEALPELLLGWWWRRRDRFPCKDASAVRPACLGNPGFRFCGGHLRLNSGPDGSRFTSPGDTLRPGPVKHSVKVPFPPQQSLRQQGGVGLWPPAGVHRVVGREMRPAARLTQGMGPRWLVGTEEGEQVLIRVRKVVRRVLDAHL